MRHRQPDLDLHFAGQRALDYASRDKGHKRVQHYAHHCALRSAQLDLEYLLYEMCRHWDGCAIKRAPRFGLVVLPAHESEPKRLPGLRSQPKMPW